MTRQRVILKCIKALGQHALGNRQGKGRGRDPFADGGDGRLLQGDRKALGVANHAGGISEQVFLDFGIVDPSPERGDFGLEPSTEFRNGAWDFHAEI